MRLVKSLTSLGISLALGTALQAQSLVSDPILLDVDGTDDGTGGPLLITAFEPDEASPVIGALSGDLQLAALDTDSTRPQPSIIVGLIAPGDEARFGIDGLLPATVAEFGFAYNDFDAREALRSTDREMLRKLIEGGHIDPPTAELSTALQTELQRMNCYRSSIDGQWGPGSRRSVTAYFDALDDGSRWPNQDPTAELFRVVILNDPVRCVARAASTGPATTTRPATTQQTQPQPAPSTAAPTRTFNNNTSGPRVLR